MARVLHLSVVFRLVFVGLLVSPCSSAPAAGAGAPSLVPTPLSSAPQDSGLRARGLAAGDLDGDGVPDLVVSYDGRDGASLVIHRGNQDSIFPFSAEARLRAAKGRFQAGPFLDDPIRIYFAVVH